MNREHKFADNLSALILYISSKNYAIQLLELDDRPSISLKIFYKDGLEAEEQVYEKFGTFWARLHPENRRTGKLFEMVKD